MFPWLAPSGLTATQGWELEDADGGQWLIEFVSPDMPQSLLSAGDTVTLHAGPKALGTLAGYIVVERNNAVQAMYVHHALPQNFDLPVLEGLEVTATARECLVSPDPNCYGALSSARVDVNGELAVLATGESANLGGLRVTNDFLGTGGGVGCSDFVNDISFGAYRLESSGAGGEGGHSGSGP